MQLLTGNEAIARGAYEYGITFASGYPGTPSTEILENVANYDDIYAQWSPNEKVALEVGIGASIAGARVMVTMKHVGLNVAADPFFTLAYTGVNGGLVIVVADDPGMHSSQNEQDSRHYARAAKVPLLEPSDSQEAKEMVGSALELSERFDTPVLLRSTTRISHARTPVATGSRGGEHRGTYRKDPEKNVMIPAYGRRRHEIVEERLLALREEAEGHPLNRTELLDADHGVITSSISYQYVREAMPGASYLKLGFSYPLPERLIREFCAQVDQVYIVEELDPFLEDEIRGMNITGIRGKDLLPRTGELNPDILRQTIPGVEDGGGEAEGEGEGPDTDPGEALPPRPPVMCPGCPHRSVFYTLKKLGLHVTGDIGCYALGVLPPLESIDTCICMGASIGVALGMTRAGGELAGNVVAVIGDSTFFHSGLTGIADMVYNNNPSVVLILDNRTTAMTGHQDHPGTGRTLQGADVPAIDIRKVVEGMGVSRVRELDPYNLEGVREAIEEETASGEPSVIIFRRPCALLQKDEVRPMTVDADRCVGCGNCMESGCPALSFRDDRETVNINRALCAACGLCSKLCPTDAINGNGEETQP